MRREPGEPFDSLARNMIGTAIEVHNHLGPGYNEIVYESALAEEMELRGLPYERQKRIVVDYKGKTVGEGRLDFLVDGKLVVEIKAVTTLITIHTGQVLSYLKTLNLPLGLLLNFNVPALREGGIKRVIRSSPLETLAASYKNTQLISSTEDSC